MSSKNKSRSSPLHKESVDGASTPCSSNLEFFTTLNDEPGSQHSLDVNDVFKAKGTSPLATVKKSKKTALKSKEGGHTTRHKSKSLDLNPSTHSKQEGKASTKKMRSLEQHLHMENNKNSQRLTTASRTIATDPTVPLSPSESYESLLGSKTFSKISGSSPVDPLPPPPPPPISSPSYHRESPLAPSIGRKSPGWKLRESYKNTPRKGTSTAPAHAKLPAALHVGSLSPGFGKSTSTRKTHTGGKHDKWDSGDKGIDTLTTSRHSRSGRSSMRLLSNSGHGTPLSTRRKRASNNNDSIQGLSTTTARRRKSKEVGQDAPAPHELPGVKHHKSSDSLNLKTNTPKSVVDRIPHIVAWDSRKSDNGDDDDNASVRSFDSTLTPSVASRDQKDSEDEYDGPDHKWNDLPPHPIPWASPTNLDPNSSTAPAQASETQHNPLPSPPFQSPRRLVVSDSSPSIPLRPRSLRLTDQDAIIEEVTSNSELAEARFEITLDKSCQMRESLEPPQRQVSRPERDDHKKEKHSHAAEMLISKITQMNDELRIKNAQSGCDSSKCSERHLPSHSEEVDESEDEVKELSLVVPAMKPRKSLESIDRNKSKKEKDTEAAGAEKKTKKTPKRDGFKKEGSKRRLMKKEASQKGLDTERIIDHSIPLPTVVDMSPEVTASLKKSKALNTWAKDFSASNHSAKASGPKKSKSVRNISSGNTKPKSTKHITPADSGDKDARISDSIKRKSLKNIKSKSTRNITTKDSDDADDMMSVKSSNSIKPKSSRSIASERSKAKSTKSTHSTSKRNSLSKHPTEEDSCSVDDASVSSNHSQSSRATCPDLSSGRGRSKLEKTPKDRVKSRSQSPGGRKKRQPKSLVQPEKLAPWQIKQQLKHRVTPVVSLYNRRLDDDDDEDVPPAFRNSKKSKKAKKTKSVDHKDPKPDVERKRNAVIGALAKFSSVKGDVPPAFKVDKM
eukprot:Nitzschia sp. Nitz4//scaffold87_size112219//40589//43459//NITZ4_004070-RA/size112219-processed-gene-0.128-mRNA-1//-1//CDS//3329559357//2242//frame0